MIMDIHTHTHAKTRMKANTVAIWKYVSTKYKCIIDTIVLNVSIYKYRLLEIVYMAMFHSPKKKSRFYL